MSMKLIKNVGVKAFLLFIIKLQIRYMEVIYESILFKTYS